MIVSRTRQQLSQIVNDPAAAAERIAPLPIKPR